MWALLLLSCGTEPSTPAGCASEGNGPEACDGSVDEGTYLYDDDGDGFSEAEGDCDDADAEVHIAADDLPGDGVDGDCDNADAPSRWAGRADRAHAYEGASEMGEGRTVVVGSIDGVEPADVFAASLGPLGGYGLGVVTRLHGATMAHEATWIASDEYDFFGAELIFHPDLTGDGLADLLAVDASLGGSAYVLPADGRSTYGATFLDARELASTEIVEDSRLRAVRVAPTSDWNGDGLPELLVNFWDTSPASTGDGTSFLGLLESPHPRTASASDAILLSEASYGGALAVDLDGDGDDEIAAYEARDAYAVHLLDGPFPAPPVHTWAMLDQIAPEAAGDLNGDGRDDLVLGMWVWSDPAIGERSGRASVTTDMPTGGTSDPLDEPVQVHAAGPFDWMGVSAAVVDFDADGQLDLTLGASGDPYLSDLPGRVHVWLGPLSGPVTVDDAWFSAHGESAADYFGSALGAGDTDGDGLPELVVGAPAWEDWLGKVYLFDGASMARTENR